MPRARCLSGFLVLVLALSVTEAGYAAESGAEQPAPEPTTTADPAIPVEDLEALVKPLSKDDLVVEADGWLSLLKAKVEEITSAQLQINRNNREIKIASEVAANAERAGVEGDAKSAELLSDRAAEAEPAVAVVKEAEVSAEAGSDTEGTQATAKLVEEQSKKAKDEVLADLSTLREERTALVDRLNVVLGELTLKIGTTLEGRDPDEVMAYRRYVDSVSGITLDVSDTRAATATLVSWLTSEEGGLRWVKNIALFVGTVLAFWALGLLASKGVGKALRVAKVSSVLLREFLITSTRRVLLAIGLVMGLSALEVNIGPLLALIGAAGFVVAFALQGTLSNFASGIMIMFYKPFDVGDFVDVADVAGTVRSMNLVSTTITTVDNKLMVVPNNSIWGNTITNVTGSAERRVDMLFGIGYDDDIAKAEEVLRQIVAEHELVLHTPEPVIQLHELGDSSVNFVVRPWARTPDYFTVFWDITRRVKERFDEEGISIPYPQRDVHVYQALPSAPSMGATTVAKAADPEREDNPATTPREFPADEDENDDGRDGRDA